MQLDFKVDCDGMKHEMLEFQATFLSTCESKSTEQLWQEFKGEIDILINKYVPFKRHRGRKILSWVTQEIRRKMNHRDHLYQVQKRYGNDADCQLFKQVKYKVDCMLKTAYNNYVDNLISVVDDSLQSDNSRPNTKKLFSYLKNCGISG